MEIKASVVFEYLQECYGKYKIVALQGGARASKTYNTLIWLAVQSAFVWSNKVVSIVRNTLPALRASAERDFFEILQNLGIYTEANHNKTERIYKFANGTIIEFFSTDNEMKVRGRKREVLFVNEANELDFATFQQLILRTSEFCVIDYNPSEANHWIYDNILTRQDCKFYKLTYKDNPFLPPSIVSEIEHLKNIDYQLWQVFGLGERGASLATIYNNYVLVDSIPDNGEVVFGLDFGFNNPTALTKVCYKNETYYIEECLYKSGLTNSELLPILQNIVGKRLVYCDSAEPARIKELQKAGINAIPAKKEVEAGVLFVKSSKLAITKTSVNLLKEIRNYKYKQTPDGKILDEVLKLNDHACDSFRYAIYTHFGNTAKCVFRPKVPKLV